MFIKRDHKNQCSCQQGPSGHGRRVKNENLYAYKQRTNAKIVGGERDETFAPHLLPRVIIILDKEITNFENEIGKIYRSQRVHSALAAIIESRLQETTHEKVNANEAIEGIVKMKDVKIKQQKNSNSELEIEGKFMKREITRATSKRLETIILTFSKMEVMTGNGKEGLRYGSSIVIENCLSPTWETRMILKNKARVSDVIEKISDIIVENFVLDIKIQDIKIDKEVFTSINYKAIPRRKLKLSFVTRIGSSTSDKANGFQIINHNRTV